MEENKDDIIYDLCNAEAAEEQRAQSSEGSDNSEGSEGSEGSECSEGSDNSEGSDTAAELAPSGAHADGCEAVPPYEAAHTDGSEAVAPCEAELQRMVEEMGAETVLSIIRDNRNAAIRQIISEVEAARPRDMPTGASAYAPCSSIFDLAALA